MSDTPQQRYSKSPKGKKSRARAQKKYDKKDYVDYNIVTDCK